MAATNTLQSTPSFSLTPSPEQKAFRSIHCRVFPNSYDEFYAYYAHREDWKTSPQIGVNRHRQRSPLKRKTDCPMNVDFYSVTEIYYGKSEE
mgnify:CR=1 FL=1